MPEKPHLLLIPGLVCDEALWRHQVKDLSDIADVVVTDKHTRYPTMKEITEAIVSEAPPKFALAGLSMGGYIAIEIVRHFPERVQRFFEVARALFEFAEIKCRFDGIRIVDQCFPESFFR